MENNSESDFEVVNERREAESAPLLNAGRSDSNTPTLNRPTSPNPSLFRSMPISLVSTAAVVLFIAVYGPYSLILSHVTRVEPAWSVNDCNDNVSTPMHLHPPVRTIIDRIISNPPGCQIITEEFTQRFTNLPVQYLHTSYKRLPYEKLNISASCVEAMEDFFSENTYDFTSAAKTEEPLYAWNGTYPCSKTGQETLERKLAWFFHGCSPKDIVFSNDGKKVQLKKIAYDHYKKVRHTCTKNHYLEPEKYHPWCEENPHEPRQRNLTDFLHATKNYKEKKIDCTKCTLEWLATLLYDGVLDEGRREMQIKRYYEAATRCYDSDMGSTLFGPLYEYLNHGEDWQETQSKDFKEILMKGMLPGDFPIRNLTAAISYENSSIGVNTLTEVLTSDERCYPFISEEQFQERIEPNPLLQQAYCNNCGKEYIEKLREVVKDDIRRLHPGVEIWQLEEKYPFKYINTTEVGRVDETLREMWNRILFMEIQCPDEHEGLTIIEETFKSYQPDHMFDVDAHHVPLHQYVNDLRKVKAMLDTDPKSIRILLHKPATDDVKELKSAYVCQTDIELVVDAAFAKEGPEFWWQPFRNAYVSWQQFRDLVEEMVGVTREWYDFCHPGRAPEELGGVDSKWKEKIDELLLKDLAEAGVKAKDDKRMLERVYGKDGRWNDYRWLQGKKKGRVMTGTIGERRKGEGKGK